MVLEYVTDRLVETVTDEIRRGQPAVLLEQPLLRAQAKDYVRQTQERLIGAPILQRLNAPHAEAGAERRLLAFLDAWRGQPAVEQGYGPGNVVNLLRLLRGDLRGLDLSRLAIRQVYMQGVEGQDASLVGAHLSEAVLGEAFAYPSAVALSAEGALLAAGTPTGEVRLWRVADRTPLMATLGGHNGMVYGVGLSRDGRLLATLQGHTGAVRAVALSGDGRLLASGAMDGAVRLWEAPNGQSLATLHGHAGAVWGVALSGGGRTVASGGDDETVRLWEAASGTCLRTLRPDRRYERLDITGLSGVTEAQRAALLELGAVETSV